MRVLVEALHIAVGIAVALLIGSLLTFVALAAVMYFTRRLDWRAVAIPED